MTTRSPAQNEISLVTQTSAERQKRNRSKTVTALSQTPSMPNRAISDGNKVSKKKNNNKSRQSEIKKNSSPKSKQKPAIPSQVDNRKVTFSSNIFNEEALNNIDDNSFDISNNSAFSHSQEYRTINQLERQLQNATKQIRSLRAEKKKLLNENQELQAHKNKTEVQFLSKKLKLHEREKEIAIESRRKLYELHRKFQDKFGHSKFASNGTSSKYEDEDEDEDDSKLPEIVTKDGETNEALQKVYELEKRIQEKLTEFENDESNMTKSRDYLDSSFETIALLMDENKHQKTILHQLNERKMKLEGQNTPTLDKNVNKNSDVQIFDKELHQKMKDVESDLNEKAKLVTTLNDANKTFEETIILKEQELAKLQEILKNRNNEKNYNDVNNDNHNEKEYALLKEENRKLKAENEILKDEKNIDIQKMESRQEELSTLKIINKQFNDQINMITSQIQESKKELRTLMDKLNRRNQYLSEKYHKKKFQEYESSYCTCSLGNNFDSIERQKEIQNTDKSHPSESRNSMLLL